MRIPTRILYALLTVAPLLLAAEGALAQGSLMVNPKRIVLDSKKRGDNVTLYNSGEDTASFAISLIHYRMLEDGTFEDIDSIKTNELFADSMIRYFPLEVTLGPHESQAIHVRFLKPKDALPGEYRSHMYFRPIERAKALEVSAKDTAAKTVSIELHAIFGLTIPIIVRNETAPAKVSMDGLAISKPDTGGRVTVTANLNREGSESTYGSLLVIYKDKNGKETQIDILKGIAVYVPLPRRKLLLQFKPTTDVDLTQGSLKLEFQSLTDNPKETILASQEIPLRK